MSETASSGEGGKSFWDTMLGTITKITSLLIAITGLMLAVSPFLKSCNENKNLKNGRQDTLKMPSGERPKTGQNTGEAEKKMNKGGTSSNQ